MQINFGKHKGKEVSELPLDYLMWGAENLTKDYVRDEFQKELEKRTSEGSEDYTNEEADYSDLIFGKDRTKHVVNVTIADDKVNIFKSDGTCDVQDYQPFILSNRPSSRRKAEKLKGNQYYKYKTKVSCEDYQELKKNWNPSLWTPRSLEEAYMIENGLTHFKDLTPQDLSVLSFDIEATTIDNQDDIAKALIISNTFRDKSGNIEKTLFDIKDFETDKEMIRAWEEFVKKSNPDVLIGHNILGYDLNYLNTRGDGLYLGRDGSAVEFVEKPLKITHAGLEYDFTDVKVFGRYVIDTQILSMKYDIGNEFPSYGLKVIEKFLKIIGDDRTEWDFSKNPTRNYMKWSEELWETFKDYARDDGDSPLAMFDMMIPAFFYLNRSVPKTLQEIVNQRTGSQIDTMMIRSYLQDGYSQPKTSPKKKYKGAISMGIPGVYKNVRKFDVASLYPSIMLEQEIYDKKKDPKRNMLNMLEYFRDERLKNKALAAEGSKYHDDLQAAQKIVINSMYGFLGTGYLLYNYMDGADAVTARGREILQIAVEWACGHRLVEVVKKIENEGKENEKIHYEWIPGDKISDGLGYTLVNTDTDAISITNDVAPTKDEFNHQIDDLNSNYSDWIEWEDDGVFENFIVVAAKNYVKQKHPDWAKKKNFDENGKVIVEYSGSKFKDSKKEPYLKRYMKNLINVFLDDSVDDKYEKLQKIYHQGCIDALHITNIHDWSVKKSVSKSVMEAKDNKEARPQESNPWRAIEEGLEKGTLESIQEGDKIWIYWIVRGMKQKVVKGEPVFLKSGKPSMVLDAGMRLVDLFDGEYHKWHYVKRVYDTLCLLENIIDKEQFEKYHLKSKRKLLDENA
jgi:DNA polymerase elongation subunit (family B)